MTKAQDLVFEINLKRATVTFFLSDLQSRAFGYRPGRSYDYAATLRAIGDTLIDRDDRDAFLRAAQLDAVRAAFRATAPLLFTDVRLRMPEGDAYEWYRISLIAPVDGICRGTVQNRQAEMEEERRLRRQAERDPLTELYNRAAFDRELHGLFLSGVAQGAFFIIDIDDFKRINDTKGHQYGDDAIVQLARKLRGVMPPQTLLGRFGGDEFILFLPAEAAQTDLEAFRARVRALCVSLTAAGTDAPYTLSVGVSFYPADGSGVGTLMQCADRALYHVKHTGKNGFAFFNTAMPHSFGKARKRDKLRAFLRRSGRRRFLLSAMVGLALALAVGFLTFAYLRSLKQMVRGDSLDYLSEIASQINTGTVKTLHAYNAQMDVVGGDLTELAPNLSIDALCTFLQKKSAAIGCEAIAAVDDESLWYTPGKRVRMPALDDYLVECTERGRSYMSEAVIIGGVDYLLIFVPVDLTAADGTHICAITAFLPLTLMRDVLSLRAFDGAGHADILHRDGRVVIRSGHDECMIRGYNLFSVLRQYTLADGDVDSLRAAFAAGDSGSVRIVVDGAERIAYFRKLDYQDWMLFAIVPARVLETRSEAFMRLTLLSCTGVAVALCALMTLLLRSQVRRKEELERLAYTDRVTGCASREKLRLEAGRLLARKGAAYTLVYTNVSRFKVVNDRLGTEGANGFLRHIAQSIDEALLDGETAGRISADHFGVLFDTQDPDTIIRRIRVCAARIVDYAPARQLTLTLSLSCGVYCVEDPALPFDIILDRANLARSAAPRVEDENVRICFYDNDLRERLLLEQRINDRMEAALQDGRFLVYLQPQYAAQSGALTSFEALVRWQSIGYGLLQPGDFIPVLERNGFIVKLDLYMFEQVCKLQRACMDAGVPVPPVSVNVSRVHLSAEDLLAPYLDVWQRYGVPAASLEFEFTESVICDDPAHLGRVIDAMHRHGFRCSMDDFGAGYSSLNMLHSTNVDVVKIDRSFLGEETTPGPRARSILQAVVSLAHSLGMATVAEGVEHATQADFLRETGCDLIQGYYFSKPLPAGDALRLWRDMHADRV